MVEHFRDLFPGLQATWHGLKWATAKALAMEHIKDVETKIRELEGMRETLISLVDACHGDDRPDCPILDDLSGRIS